MEPQERKRLTVLTVLNAVSIISQVVHSIFFRGLASLVLVGGFVHVLMGCRPHRTILSIPALKESTHSTLPLSAIVQNFRYGNSTLDTAQQEVDALLSDSSSRKDLFVYPEAKDNRLSCFRVLRCLSDVGEKADGVKSVTQKAKALLICHLLIRFGELPLPNSTYDPEYRPMTSIPRTSHITSLLLIHVRGLGVLLSLLQTLSVPQNQFDELNKLIGEVRTGLKQARARAAASLTEEKTLSAAEQEAIYLRFAKLRRNSALGIYQMIESLIEIERS